MYLNYLSNINYYIPELVMVAVMFGLLILEATYKSDDNNKRLFNLFVFVGLIICGILLIFQYYEKLVFIFTNSIVIDHLAITAKLIMLAGLMGSIFLGLKSRDIHNQLKSEFIILSVGIFIGGMLLVSATNMLILYIGIETLSILSYSMSSLKKNDSSSSEAGIKYSLYGGVCSGIMLFGLSHIYGVLGTISFIEVAEKLNNLSLSEVSVMIPSLLLFFVGLGYKIACVPFHMWSPDVYEGSPMPVTLFFSIVPKVAGIVAVLRISLMLFSDKLNTISIFWSGLLMIVAALTITIGNIAAIGQKSLKRMMAYSSISHSGVMLAGVLVLGNKAIQSVMFYLLVYYFMTIVVFYIISFVNDKYGNDDFERFNGFVYRYPIMAISMSIAMFSLAGLPPLGGFIAKFHIIYSLITSKYYSLAVIVGINSVISLFYYMKIVRHMTINKSETQEDIKEFSFINQFIIVILTTPIIFIGIFWNTLSNFMSKLLIIT